jgi:hypothetical protein
MTEADWLASEDPRTMLAGVIGRGCVPRPGVLNGHTSRKLRLFACGCCRLVWVRLTGEQSRRAVEVAERYADSGATEDERSAADLDAATATGERPSSGADLAMWVCVEDSYPLVTGRHYSWQVCGVAQDLGLAAAEQASLLRDIFGNPFRPAAISPAWLTPDVVHLAHAAYDERLLPSGQLDRQRLLVLADALEEAGCTNAEVLGHLRGPGLHVRGCFLLDLLVGRE